MVKPATGTTTTATEAPSILSPAPKWTSERYRLLTDRAAKWVIGLGGIGIVAVILAILVVLLLEVAPLFQAPAARHLGSVTAAAVALPARIGVDEYREVLYLADLSGVKMISLKDGAELTQKPAPSLEQDSIAAVSGISQGKLAFATRAGKIIFCEVKFDVSFPDGTRKIDSDAVFGDPVDIGVPRPPGLLAYTETSDGKLVVGKIGPRELAVSRVTEQKGALGSSTFSQQTWRIELPLNGEISTLAPDNRAEDVFIGTNDGQIARVDLRDGQPRNAGLTAAGTASITALSFLIGDRTLIAGDAQGNVSSWQLLPGADGDKRLQRIHEFGAHSSPVTAISPSVRDKGFLTGDEKGGILLHYSTTGQTRLRLRVPDSDLQALAYAPRADGFVTFGSGGAVNQYSLENHHPEITLGSLFGKVWYEGNTQPDHTWQSTGGADDFEGKFSLVPLIFGTLKGSSYSLLFAMPLAILAALYCSQFLRPHWKGVIKPTVEIMAGLPSVVLGFIAALWLAPNIDTVLPGIVVMPLILPVSIVASAFIWNWLPARFRSRIKPGRELIALIPVIGVSTWLSLGPIAAQIQKLIGGDYHSWMANHLGLAYDQRNSLVVSIAMGFAVIPIIFTIAEDAFSSVPRHLVLAGRALGANKWQTALRVVVPTASPGIFSAIMVGLGRAVGETMIVLMATGNTPITSWNIFNGFRALSANIAVELPEAPAGGSLYRVLFLSALLLFLLTFILNTAAELVRLKLRKRYSSL